MFGVNYITYEFHFSIAEEVLQNVYKYYKNVIKKGALGLMELSPVKANTI